MKTRRVLCLTEPTTFRQPSAWEFQTRYALRRSGGEVRLPAGDWLVELDPLEIWPGQENEYPYRTPAGEIVALAAPLPQDRYREVRDPQVITALNAFRSLEAILSEDFGLSPQRTCRELPPFALIQCPLCRGTEFTTLDFASAWCDGCNASFRVRSTAGDPGFVVDLTWAHYHPLAARYLLPRTDRLLSTLVLKDSRDPRDMSRDNCTEACRNGPICLTDGGGGLRPGLHRCQIGTLYDWRRIYGQAPTPEDLRGEPQWEIDGRAWPAAAAIRTLPLNASERRALELARSLIAKEYPGAARTLREILNLRARSPYVFEAMLPDVRRLEAEECYLLHHWAIMPPDDPGQGREIALPVWYVVTPTMKERTLSGWEVVRKDICPRCAEPVAPDEITVVEAGRNRWEIPHAYCREAWDKTGWRPPGAQDGSGKDQASRSSVQDD